MNCTRCNVSDATHIVLGANFCSLCAEDLKVFLEHPARVRCRDCKWCHTEDGCQAPLPYWVSERDDSYIYDTDQPRLCDAFVAK